MRALRRRLVRFAALGSLVFAYLGVSAPPAAAFVSTGTVTVEGWYYYSYSSYTTTYPYNDWTSSETYMSIYSNTCVDSWTGTTTPGSGTGATCTLWLYGSHSAGYLNGNLYSSSGSGLRFDGGYAMSNGTWGYNLRLAGDSGTLTGTISSSDSFAGPVTVTYRGVATNSYSCSAACSPNYYSYSDGPVTLTLDYVIH